MLNHQGKIIDNTRILDIDEQLKTVLDLINDLTNIKAELDREEQNKLRKSDTFELATKFKKHAKESKRSRKSRFKIINELNPPRELDLNEE